MTLQEALEAALVSWSADGQAELRFRREDFFFEGHFPGHPVLPAVVQVGAAVWLSERLAGAPQRLVEVTRAKFTSPTGPDRLLRLTISIESDNGRNKVRASITDAGVLVSEFSLRVEPA